MWYFLWAESRKQRNPSLGLDWPWTWKADWSDAQRPFFHRVPHHTLHRRHVQKKQYWALLFLPESVRAPVSNCVAFSWAFWKQNCSTFYTDRKRKWGKQHGLSGLKKNRRNPLLNSPHSHIPRSMKNGAKLSICKSLMKNKIKPKPLLMTVSRCLEVTTKCLCAHFIQRKSVWLFEFFLLPKKDCSLGPITSNALGTALLWPKALLEDLASGLGTWVTQAVRQTRWMGWDRLLG